MDWEDDNCPICNTKAKGTDFSNNQAEVHCPLCGNYKITSEASSLRNRLVSDRVLKAKDPKIYGWIRLQNRNGNTPRITSDLLQSIVTAALPNLLDRADYLLDEAASTIFKRDEMFSRREPRYLAASFSDLPEEAEFVWKILFNRGFAEPMTNQGGTRVTIDGHLHAETLKQTKTSSEKVFIAMWFNNEMDEAYDKGLQIGVLDAGYKPVRIDRVEHTNKIDDEIIASIRTSAFIVADFTGHRAGVNFEAGFAMGLGMPVVWTCREDEIEDLHFDIRQYNCVPWKEPKDLAEKLKNRIEATIGRGPN
ncbi:MAG: nucleoside 2-deoxyribosyltransferase [Alphaproteobacteria bacterium]|nr:nucleoside 2-deoxyribosyltransferase [Alphaproteobacteria bacterium]